MATCEFHQKYTECLTGQIAIELIDRKGRELRDWSEVWYVVKRIAICQSLEQITTEEANNLTSITFQLYPQFEEKIRAELTHQFG